MGYDHTQKGPWFLLLFAVSAGSVVGGWSLRGEPIGHYMCLSIALLMFALGICFVHLRICDEVDALAVRFGPLPLFATRVEYDKIQDVAADRTTLLDGWGVHWIPGRGTTYNIWGFQCVRVELPGRTIRIGSNDVAQLLAFLQQKTGRRTDGSSFPGDDWGA